MAKCPFRCTTYYRYDAAGRKVTKMEEFGECYGRSCPAHFFVETEDGETIDGCELCSGPEKEEDL